MGSIVIGLALAVVAVLLAARFGAFAGRAPAGLGVADAKLKRPPRTPNAVTSQLDLWPDAAPRADLRIGPIALLSGGGPATIARIAQVIEDLPNARIVERRDDYLYAQFTSALLRFVDDVEFWFDPAAGVVQVRSASRVGRKDFGVNRARIEQIRSRLG
jgi:uncharacterized protein (DUF1499 family)